jgi:hypothetical protein
LSRSASVSKSTATSRPSSDLRSSRLTAIILDAALGGGLPRGAVASLSRESKTRPVPPASSKPGSSPLGLQRPATRTPTKSESAWLRVARSYEETEAARAIGAVLAVVAVVILAGLGCGCSEASFVAAGRAAIASASRGHGAPPRVLHSWQANI